MRIPARRRSMGIGFNLTAMIDVVFNLIVFFLVASHFSQSQSELPITLPTASQASESEASPRNLTITITPEGTWHVRNQPVTLAEIEQMIREGAGESPDQYSVQIRGDASARFEFIEPLLLACARSGVTGVRFQVLAQ